MSNKPCTGNITRSLQAKEINKFKLTPLTLSIRELVALSGLVIVSSGALAEKLVNPNEVWLNSGSLKGICAKDIDQDSDVDLFTVYSTVVKKIENTGTPTSPKFSSPKPFVSNQSKLKLNRLGLTDCFMNSYESSAAVDIDADGDLDLFRGSWSKYSGLLSFSRNMGTSEDPIYIEENPNQMFGLPSDAGNFMFKDIDGDGDQDFWAEPLKKDSFYENTGTPENAAFVKQKKSPIKPLCNNEDEINGGYGLIVDLNNDSQWDMLCKGNDDQLYFIESSNTGYLPKKNILTTDRSEYFDSTQAVDVDGDGDVDIIAISENNVVLYHQCSHI
ncbi:MAG: VCBS repeat-containing protein, partial [Methylococcales bacterium]|nr:VCBS repeat-containing protein [Methylococcales bacterium]